MRVLKMLFQSYWNVSLLKDGPGNTPYSPFLFFLSIILFTLVMTVQWGLANSLWLYEFSISFSLVCSFIMYTAFILFLKKYSARFIQTTTCLFSTHAMMHFFAIPIFLLDPYLTPENLKNPVFLFLAMIYLFITLGLSIWQFVITAHIYKHALNVTPIQSTFCALGLVAVNVLILTFWR
jgi:hypothetical protein